MEPPDQPTLFTEPRTPRPSEQTKRPGRTGRFLRWAACAALIGVGCVALCWWIFWRPQQAQTPNGTNATAAETPPWKPRPPLTPQELAKLPSPLDALKREAMELPEGAPPELVAILGERPRFPFPPQSNSSWMAQTGDGRLLAVPCDANIL